MLSGSKRRVLTTDDLMRRQELGPRKRQRRAKDEDEDSLRGSEGPTSEEGSQSDGLDEGEDDEDSTSEIPMSDTGEDDTIPSRFSFNPRQGSVVKMSTVPSHVSSLPLTFAEVGVSSSLVSAMNKMSIRTPTEIQTACIPPLLDGMYFYFCDPPSVLMILAR